MDETARLRRKDTTKGAPLRILCLDGGGVRGYSMLIILQELMHRTFVETEGRAPQRHEIPKPCDHFDLIAGVGTGGLIAIMLGRLRLDLDTCKDLYVRMTRRVFETDKTFAGIPLKSTMFKASKLEEVIREAVREHTVFDSEGNDVLASATPMSPSTPRTPNSGPARTMSQSSRYSSMGQSPSIARNMGFGSLRFGDPDALLYDQRENRTKTVVTAVLKGTTRTEFLRSYDSRKEPAPDVNCTIWQAGRATSAAAMAFKPVRIGQSIYLDEGAARYNPSPEVLDEAVVNEWPGRDVGVFVSIGTGKRARNTNAKEHEWWEGFLGSTMGDFAEARRKMIVKLEACETIHEFMLQQHLHTRQVNRDNYFRLNVEVGVGEFGMNEWNRLSQISTNTRIYLSKPEIEDLTHGVAAKLAKVHFTKLHHQRALHNKDVSASPLRNSWQSGGGYSSPISAVPPPLNPNAVELPGDLVMSPIQQYQSGGAYYDHRGSIADAKYTVLPDDNGQHYNPASGYHQSPGRTTSDHSAHQTTLSPYANQPHPGVSPRSSGDYHHSVAAPPPRPPKTPTDPASNLYNSDRTGHVSSHTSIPQRVDEYGQSRPSTFMNMGELSRNLPYPDQKGPAMDGPAPSVNMQSKPQI